MVRKTNFKALDDFIDLSTQDALKTIDDITPEKLREAAIAIAKNPPTKEKLQEFSNRDIENLLNDFKLAEESYNQIYIELSSVDSQLKTAWAPKWKVLWMEFTNLTTKSKEVAASLSNYARHHVQVLLPYLASKDNSFEDKKPLIKQTIDTIKKRQAEAEKFSEDFKSHKAKCIAFKSNFETWAKDEQKKLINQIADVKSEIQHIEAEIKNLDAKVTGLAIGICLSIFAAATTLLAGFFNPWFWIGTAISVASIVGCSVALSVVLTKRNDLHHKLNEKNSELSKLKQQQQSVNNALVVSASLDDKLKNIYKFCDFFVNFWQGIASKLQKCLDQESILEGELESPLGIVPGEYKFTENLWNVLADSLDLYSSGGISGQ